MTSSRIELFRKEMVKNKFDAFFVSDQYNVSFLTGFKGLVAGVREAFFLITKNSTYFITFSTCSGLFKESNKHFKVLCATPFKGLTEILEDIIKNKKIKKLGFEKSGLTYSEYLLFRNKLSAEFIGADINLEKFRVIKSDEEIKNITSSAEITDKAFLFALKEIKKDVTEKELALKTEFFIKTNSQDIAFSPIVAFNENAAIPHYLPSDKIKLRNNSLILIDIGSKINNYCSDLSRVVFFGTPGNAIATLYNTVINAQTLAINSIKIGSKGLEIDQIARRYIEKQNFPAYQHGLGHGVGLAIHENPKIAPQNQNRLLQNMVFTVEPGIYLEGVAGVRIEDLLVLRKDGPEFLSHSTKEIIIL